ncbi:protein Spindly, partial [Diretmus argenteus]
VTWKAQLSCPAPAYGGDGQDPTYYADLLQMKLNNSVKASERQADELSLQRMKCLSESQRALQLERKLFSSERLLKQAQGDKLKLQLRVEELQEKYEPTEAKEECIRKRKREKLPVDITPSSEVTSVNAEPIVAVAMDVPNSRTADADACTIALPDNSTQGLSSGTKVKGSVPDPQTTKSVTISEDVPVVIPSSSLTECEVNKEEEEIQQQTKREAERRKKQRTVEVIHVRAKDTMESQCAQQ